MGLAQATAATQQTTNRDVARIIPNRVLDASHSNPIGFYKYLSRLVIINNADAKFTKQMSTCALV